MTTAALVIALVWFATAFAVRIGIQLRRTGDSGVRLHNGSIAATLVKVLFTTSIIAVGLAPLFVSTDGLATIDSLQSDPAGIAGLVLAVAGIAATFAAQLAMGHSWRIGVDPDERTDLVTSGVFGVVRNPIFSTMAATSVGLVLMVPTAVGLAGLVLMLVALELQVRAVEEPYLRTVHGPDYLAYAARVGRFVPGLGHRV
jgi:protein-S-isoprenylcysteine O-methyltransferase Ste14